MQTAQIKIGSTYAIQRVDRGLCRFVVTAIVGRKTSHRGQTDYTIEGYLVEDKPGVTGMRETIKTSASSLLGSYEDVQELRDRAADERKAEEARKKQDEDDRNELVKVLYQIAGIRIPDGEGYRHEWIYRASYSGLNIAQDGVRPLLDALKKRPGLKLVSG